MIWEPAHGGPAVRLRNFRRWHADGTYTDDEELALGSGTATPAEIDLGGDLVVPGLIDVHAHVFDGVGASVHPDRDSLARGATTAVDAGSSGAATFRAFRRVAGSATARVLAWLNLSTIGLVDARVGELLALPWVDVDACVATIRKNRDLIVGIKARLSAYVTGASCLPVLRLLREAADQAAVPVMVHIGDTNEDLGQILPFLRAGDVVTHVFTGRRNGILRVDGTLHPAVSEARARGVLFDSARGGNHAAFPEIEGALEQGFRPDSIATDITTITSADPAFGLAAVATEFLAFGLELADILPMMTTGPATMIGRPELAELADATILRLEEGAFTVTDVDGRTRNTERRLRVTGVVRDGAYQTIAN